VDDRRLSAPLSGDLVPGDANPGDAVAPAVRDAILAWYATRARSLPFRGATDPYAILVSEAMAQQTQAARAGEVWSTFMVRFPTVHALAAAPLADVLRAWQGLGYNRRARDLWRAAGRIVEGFAGEVPADLAALESLPGVGPYTARAIGALAFGMPVGAVDTNVRRVLGRILAGGAGSLTPAQLQRVADASVPTDRPGAWTHALMDAGALLCHPRRPDCLACPARPWCRYAGAAAIEGRAASEAHAATEARTTPAPFARHPGRFDSARAAATSTRVGPAAIREVRAPFQSTSRWLRGRILDRLRHAANGDWVILETSMGEHGALAVGTAARALAKDGLLELDDTVPAGLRARLPIT